MENNIRMNHSLHIDETTVFTYKLNIGDFYSEDSDVDKIISQLESATENDLLEININSTGGDLDEMNRFVNLINDYFYGRTTTKLNPVGYSAGAFLFLHGDSRIVYENSCFMIHDAKIGMSGKNLDLKNHAKFNDRYLNSLLYETLELFFTKNEINEIINGKEFWFDAYELCKRGIATDIRFFNQLLTSQEFTQIMKTPRSKKEFFSELLNDEFLSERDRLRITQKLKRL